MQVKRAICSIAMFALGAVCAMGCQSSVPVPSPLTSGLPAAIKTALTNARTAVVDHPNSSIVWGAFGKLCMAHQFPSEAIACFQMAAKLDPKNGRWSYFEGVILEEIDLKQSEACYRATIALDGRLPTARLRLAQIRARLGDRNTARSEFQIVAELKPDHPAPRLALARLAITESDWPTVEENLNRALMVAPHCRAIYEELARVAARRGHWNDAFRYQNSALLAVDGEITIDDQWLQEIADLELVGRSAAERADQYLAKGQISAAASELRSVVRDHPELPRARLNLAVALWQLGRTAESQREFHQLVTLFPDEPSAYLTWGRLLASVGRFQEAKHRLEQAIDRKADAAEASEVLGTIAERQGYFQEAIEWYQRAIRTAPEQASTYLALANLYRQSGEISAANRILKMAASLKFSDQSLRQRIENQLLDLDNEPKSALRPENVN